MEKTEHSISSAARIVGVSRATIARHIKKGKLTATLDSENNKQIDASELVRVYGDQCKFDGSRDQVRETLRSETELAPLLQQTKQLNDQLIAQYKSQVDDLREALSKAQDGLNRTTLLLENHTKKDSNLQEQVSRLEVVVKAQRAESSKIKRALYEERSSPLWNRLFRKQVSQISDK